MAPSSDLVRSNSKSSLMSATTYHSFHDHELYEPVVYSQDGGASIVQPDLACKEFVAPVSMHRQDSGYESLAQQSTTATRRRTSVASSSHSRPRTRPSVRRATKSGPVAVMPRASGHSFNLPRSSCSYQQSSYFQFPSPDPLALDDERTHDQKQISSGSPPNSPLFFPFALQGEAPPRSETPSYPIPPQTTHYWTSDRTRRLEYAAIDAAGRGVKGWVMRNLVPDCFVPKEKRHVGFDDDGGSVRRYRLELDTEESGEKDDFGSSKKKKSWFGMARP